MIGVPHDLWRGCENIEAHDLVRAVDDAARTVLGFLPGWNVMVYWVPKKALFAEIVFRGEPSVGTVDRGEGADRPAMYIKGWGTFLNGEVLVGSTERASRALAQPLTAGQVMGCVAHEWGHDYVARHTRYGQDATCLVDRWREAVARQDWELAKHEGSRSVELIDRYGAVDEGWARFLGDKLTDRLQATHPQFTNGMVRDKPSHQDYELRQRLLDQMADAGASRSRGTLEHTVAGHRMGLVILAHAAFCWLAEQRGIVPCLAALSTMHQWADPVGELLALAIS